MKVSKRLVSLFLIVAMVAFVVTGCAKSPNTTQSAASANLSVSSETPKEKTTIKIAALKGPTGLGMLKLMSDNEAKTAANNYQFTIASAADEIVSKISSGEVDAAAVPTNLAAALYNKTNGKVQLAALNTLGVLYVVVNGENVSSIKDLKGKTIVSSGQGAIPEYAFNYILKANGLEIGKDVKVEYKVEHSEVASLLISGKAKIAVLPEPFVTQVTTKNKAVKVALNITKEWDKAVNSKSVLTMGCLIVRKDFAEKNKEAFNKFLDEYKASATYTNSNVDAASVLSQKYDIMPAAVAKKAIPNCNIVYIDGTEMKSKTADFLNVLFKANPKSVGGKIPSEDFYYSK